MHTRPSNLCLLWLFIFPLVYSQELSRCIPPHYCVNIRQCQPHLEILVKYGNTRGDYLRSLVCGCDGGDPMVCCPSDGLYHPANIAITTPVPPSTPEPPGESESEATNEHFDDDYTELPIKIESEPLVYSSDIPDIRCMGRTEYPSYCTSALQCQPVLNLLRKYGTAVREDVRNLDCGRDDNNKLMVCCPFDDHYDLASRTPLQITPPESQTVGDDTQPNGPLLAPHCGVNKQNDAIQMLVNGELADDGRWPWMAILGYRSASDVPEWKCGGSLISPSHVLTAAHCVQQDLYLVRLGDSELDESIKNGAYSIHVEIEKSTIHPEFSSVTYSSDIAVLKLARKVLVTASIRAICLPIPDEIRYDNLTSKQPYVAGWGATMYHGLGSKYLQEQQLPVLDNEQCQMAYAQANVTIDNRVICAGYIEGGKGTCHGDSGGPVMSSWPANGSRGLIKPDGEVFYVVGIVSYSHRCAQRGYPGVFTRVAEFLDFILQQMIA